MKKSVYKIIIAVIICAFLIVGVLVGTSLINSRTMTMKQAAKQLQYMGETYANEFYTVFSDSELLVNNMAIVIENDYNVSEYINNTRQFQLMFEESSMLFEEVIKHFNYPVGLYVTFDPETSKGKNEIWLVKNNIGEISYMDSRTISSEWLAEENKDTEYYFRTIREGSYWSEAEYDLGMDGEVITYTRALYDEDKQLIGVIGVDILVDDIFATLDRIGEEIDGTAVLIDNEKGVIGGSDIKQYKESDYIYAEAAVGERWTIALAQPVKTAIEPIIKTEFAIILLGILICITVIVLIFAFSRRKVEPIIKEVEYKDIMLINQARQAKMGEMVGNIAHQWKQPLNGMKMSLSNLRDDYEQKLLTDEDFESYMQRMQLMVGELTETANDFIAFMKPARRTEHFSINEEIRRTVSLMDEQLRLRRINIEITGQDIEITGYRNEFTQCIFNLIDNAADAMTKLPQDMRQIVISTAEENGWNTIKVFNNGEPIHEEYKGQILELYYSTKDENDGSGIGLYLANEIIKSHFNGKLDYENVSNGVVFSIAIPAGKEEDNGDNQES